MLTLFSKINFAYVLEINIFGRNYSNLPKILFSSKHARFIIENRDNIWCNFMHLKKDVMELPRLKYAICLKNNGPHITVPLICWFLNMTFNLCFHHQLWVKLVCIHIGNSSGHIGQTHSQFWNVCGCLTLNKMYIKLASLIIFLTNNKLTNTSSSTPPPEVKKTTVYSSCNNFVYLNRNFHLMEI